MLSLKYTTQYLLMALLSLQLVSQNFAIPIEANKDKVNNALQTRGFITDTLTSGIETALRNKSLKDKKEDEEEEAEERGGKSQAAEKSSKPAASEEQGAEENAAAGDELPEEEAAIGGALAGEVPAVGAAAGSIRGSVTG